MVGGCGVVMREIGRRKGRPLQPPRAASSDARCRRRARHQRSGRPIRILPDRPRNGPSPRDPYGEGGSVTWVGTDLFVVVPSPSWPNWLSPQTHSVPSRFNARL